MTNQDTHSDDALSKAQDAAEKEAQDKASQSSDNQAAKSESGSSEDQDQKDKKDQDKAKEDIYLKEINNLKAEIGRGQKALNEVGALRTQIENSTNTLQSQTQAKKTEEESDNIVTTVADVRNVFNQFKDEETQAQRTYNHNYTDNLAQLAVADNMDDEEIKQLDNILQTSVQGSDSNYVDPKTDAKINYLQAKLIMKETNKKSVNLKGDKPQGTGVPGGSKEDSPDNTMPKLDEHAEAFVKWAGMDSKKVTAALKGEASGGLRR